MAEGHGPTHGAANALYSLGRGMCPKCRGDLTDGAHGGVRCLDCDETYPIGGVRS